MYRGAGVTRSRAALCLPRVSQGGHSTPRQHGGAAGRVLRGENERSVRKNGDCNRLICRDCTVIDHNGHNFNFLKKCAPESRKTLLHDSLAPLRKVQADISRAEKKLNATEAQVDTQKNEVCKSLEQSFDQLKALLDQRKAELVKKASALAQEKKDALAAQRKGLQVAQAEIHSLVEFVERNVENTSDQDLMGIRTQLQTKVEEEEKQHQQLSLEPATTADIPCNPPSPDAIPRELGAVFRAVTPTVLASSRKSYSVSWRWW